MYLWSRARRAKVGAAQLVARGAMRAGAGVATIATWPSAANAIESGVLEAMTARIDPAAIPESVDPILRGKHAVVVGPGFGLSDDARIAVEYVLAAWQGPIVADADALTMLGGTSEASLLAGEECHSDAAPGRASRGCLEKTTAQVEGDRFRAARELVAATGSVVVLKGAHTIIAGPDSRIAVSPVSSCPALATAGSGDVLAGVIGADGVHHGQDSRPRARA